MIRTRVSCQWRSRALRNCAFLLLVCSTFSCSRAPTPPEADPPPAPVKWEGPKEIFLEEWTEVVGTTLPLPDRAARVTSPVTGRVLAVLPHRYDLRLLPPLDDVRHLPTTGNGLIVAAMVKDVLHFRVFNSSGGSVDLDEKRLSDQSQQVDGLRKQFQNLWPPHEMTSSERDTSIASVMAIVGPLLPSGDGKPVVEGQTVAEGDVLVRLDATAVLATLAKAEAAKKVLQAERVGALSTMKQAAMDLKSQEDLKLSSSTIPVSAVALEKARLTLESAQAAVLVLDRKLEAAEKEEASLDLEIRLYTLSAPRKGRLGRVQVVIGQTLNAGAPVADVVDIDDEIDVLCFVSAADARKLQLGQPAHISSEAAADPEGKVVYVADQAEPDTGSFAVKVRFPNSDLKLRASSVARVRIQTKPDKLSWAVHESALMEDQDPPVVVVVEGAAVTKNADGKDEQTGKVRRLRAVTGMRDRVKHFVEIVSLHDDEKKWHGDLEHALIVISKGQGLQTGDAVRLEEDEDD
jgi:RND family efflux transporter MFP subunit